VEAEAGDVAAVVPAGAGVDGDGDLSSASSRSSSPPLAEEEGAAAGSVGVVERDDLDLSNAQGGGQIGLEFRPHGEWEE